MLENKKKSSLIKHILLEIAAGYAIKNHIYEALFKDS
jgi:hypothetical protein